MEEKETGLSEIKRIVPGYLVVKPDVMESVLLSAGKTVRAFADDLNIGMAEAYSLLSGERVGVETARKFISYYGAEYAHRYIDWPALGVPDPYPKVRKRAVIRRHFDRRNTG